MAVYDPNSLDAMFSRILQRLDQQDRKAEEDRVALTAKLEEIQSDVRQAHGRVGKLEVWRNDVKAKVTVVAGLISLAVTSAWQWWLNRPNTH